MITTQWIITLIVTLVAGGAMGAVITAISNARRSRIQPIQIRKEVIPFIIHKIGGQDLQAEIVLKYKGEVRSFDNLSLARVTLRNTGNKDYEEFNFGLTIPGLRLAVLVQPETQDRYHEMTFSPQIDLSHLDNEIDFTLKPFNRNDTYSVVLGILPPPVDHLQEEDLYFEIEPVTKHPVVFVEESPYRAVAKAFGIEIIDSIPLTPLPLRIVQRKLKE